MSSGVCRCPARGEAARSGYSSLSLGSLTFDKRGSPNARAAPRERSVWIVQVRCGMREICVDYGWERFAGMHMRCLIDVCARCRSVDKKNRD